MDEALAGQIWQRARERCEYCLLPSALSILPFEINHIIPRKHGGLTVEANLALACFYCNRYKGPNIAGLDPDTRALSRLFDPRQDSWNEHFRWNEIRVDGVSSLGRTTIEVLRLNHAEILLVRQALKDEGVFPF
jgi:HNH endonuclease